LRDLFISELLLEQSKLKTFEQVSHFSLFLLCSCTHEWCIIHIHLGAQHFKWNNLLIHTWLWSYCSQ